METSTARAIHDPAADFYIDALRKLQGTNIPFLVGGAFAFSHYSHVPRDTKDIDVFVKPDDCPRVLAAFEELGYDTDMPFPHWLGKIHSGGYFMDVIFNSGNGIARVDDLWFEHAPKTNVLGLIVRLCPVEEMLWSKAFIQERERFDGADVLHLLRETGPSLDWPRLLMRFGDYWRILLSHIILFGFVYPDKRQNVPAWVMEELMRRLSVSRPNLQNDICYGTILSREQYLHDIEHLKYRDGREEPEGLMTRDQIKIWTDAIPTRKREEGRKGGRGREGGDRIALPAYTGRRSTGRFTMKPPRCRLPTGSMARTPRRTISVVMPKTKCEANAWAWRSGGCSLVGRDRPSSGTATSSAAAHTAVPNAAPPICRVAGDTSQRTPYKAPIAPPNAKCTAVAPALSSRRLRGRSSVWLASVCAAISLAFRPSSSSCQSRASCRPAADTGSTPCTD